MISLSKAVGITFLVIFNAAFVLVSAQVAANGPKLFPGQTEGDFVVHDFRFNSGEVLPELRLHYVFSRRLSASLGRARKDRLLSWDGGATTAPISATRTTFRWPFRKRAGWRPFILCGSDV